MTIVPAGPTPGAMLSQSPRLVAGVGCASAASAAEIIALVQSSLAQLGATADQLTAIASHTRKWGHPGLAAAARHFDVPLCLLSDDALASDAAPSARVMAAIGLPAIAEAAAMAAGPLLLPKRKSAHATCALSACDAGFDALAVAQFGSANAAMAASMLSTSCAGP